MFSFRKIAASVLAFLAVVESIILAAIFFNAGQVASTSVVPFGEPIVILPNNNNNGLLLDNFKNGFTMTVEDTTVVAPTVAVPVIHAVEIIPINDDSIMAAPGKLFFNNTDTDTVFDTVSKIVKNMDSVFDYCPSLADTIVKARRNPFFFGFDYPKLMSSMSFPAILDQCTLFFDTIINATNLVAGGDKYVSFLSSMDHFFRQRIMDCVIWAISKSLDNGNLWYWTCKIIMSSIVGLTAIRLRLRDASSDDKSKYKNRHWTANSPFHQKNKKAVNKNKIAESSIIVTNEVIVASRTGTAATPKKFHCPATESERRTAKRVGRSMKRYELKSAKWRAPRNGATRNIT